MRQASTHAWHRQGSVQSSRSVRPEAKKSPTSPPGTSFPPIHKPGQHEGPLAHTNLSPDASKQLLTVADDLKKLQEQLSIQQPATASKLCHLCSKLSQVHGRLSSAGSTAPSDLSRTSSRDQQHISRSISQVPGDLSVSSAVHAGDDAYARLFSGAATTAPVELGWYYLDDERRARGPYDAATMIRWYCQSFLEDQLPVSAVVLQPDCSAPQPPLNSFQPLVDVLQQVAQGGCYIPVEPYWSPGSGYINASSPFAAMQQQPSSKRLEHDVVSTPATTALSCTLSWPGSKEQHIMPSTAGSVNHSPVQLLVSKLRSAANLETNSPRSSPSKRHSTPCRSPRKGQLSSAMVASNNRAAPGNDQLQKAGGFKKHNVTGLQPLNTARSSSQPGVVSSIHQVLRSVSPVQDV